MKTLKNLLTVCTAAVLAACSNMAPLSKKNDADTAEVRTRLDQFLTAQTGRPSSFSETDTEAPKISIKPLDAAQQAAHERKWLTDIQHISLDPASKEPIRAPALIRMLRAKGINIVSHIPLDLYSYNGFGVTDVNAETALLVFLGSMGLDYELDHVRKLVIIQPMKSATWTLNIGNRRTSFNAGDESTGNSTGTIGSTGPAGSNNALGMGTTGAASSSYYGAQPGTGTNPLTSNAGAATTGGTSSTGSSNTITTVDSVWSTLLNELNQRLTILLPKTPGAATNNPVAAPTVPAFTQAVLPGGMPGDPNTANSAASQFYNLQKVGTAIVNADTGAITVQAPMYLMGPINEYMKGVVKKYNTTITFEAELITVTTSNKQSEGIDWTAFNQVNKGNYTTIAQNNILGGAVITPAQGTSAAVDALTIGNSMMPGANALFGLVSLTKHFAAFNAYLSSIGHLKIKETPIIQTTSDVPVKLKNTTIRRYQTYQQTAAQGGTGSAAVATNTIDVPYETGMILRLLPRYDVSTGLIRTTYAINRIMLQSWEPKINPITTANGGVQIINTRTPILGSTEQNGELNLKNGQIVVVGGLKEDTDDDTTSGVTGLLESPLKALTGQDARNSTTTTYYFLLRVVVNDPTEPVAVASAK